MDVMSAKLVAEGVGEPTWWHVEGEGRMARHGSTWEVAAWARARMVVGPQTAFGLAMKLDEWEPRQDSEVGVWVNPSKLFGIFSRWTQACGATLGTPAWGQFIGMMIARIEHIGRDHAIRRALEWTVEPGTLATLSRNDEGCWFLYDPLNQGDYPVEFDPTADSPALAGVTDPTEALRVICEVVGTTVVPDNKGHQCFAGEHVDLTDYQIRAGLLRQLAIWAGDDGKAQAYWLSWSGGTVQLWSPPCGRPIAQWADGPSAHERDGQRVYRCAVGPDGGDALGGILTAIGKGEVTRG